MGFIAMMQRLPQERVGAAVSNTAHAAQILRETIDYTKERKAFGQAIGSFQHNKFKIAELVTKIEVTQAYVDDCVLAHSRGELTPIDAAKAKWWSAEVQNDVLDACVQLYGGYGFMNEYRHLERRQRRQAPGRARWRHLLRLGTRQQRPRQDEQAGDR